MTDAFYVPDGERFASMDWTRGPWDDAHQHAGPPAALLARALERCGEPDGRQVARVTVEVLGPVPIAPLRPSARVVRPGRRVELVEGALAGPEGDVMLARAWRLLPEPITLPAGLAEHPPPPGPAQGRPAEGFLSSAPIGWHTAMEMRFVTGGFREPGPAKVWFRPRLSLVAGEQTSPLSRVMLAADAGNGISAALPWERFTFVNLDLSVHLARLPRGEWVYLDAVTLPQPDGIGLAESALHDEQGRIGIAAQSLLVRERG